MRQWWDQWPELRDLEPSSRRAVWQAAYGEVSARPVHFRALGCMAACAAAGVAIGDTLWPGWPGRIVGACIGGLIGSLAYSRIMRRAMLPHVTRQLSDRRESQ